MIFIGASLGGVRALTAMFRNIPITFQTPSAVVLHRQKDSDGMLLEVLQRDLPLQVIDPLDKEPILPGRIYLAPADYHLLVEPTHFCLSVDDPIRYARPSIDVLFESAADAFGREAIGIILSGANSDGSEGASKIKARGGRIIVQAPGTAEAPQMPQAALSCIDPDYILPLDQIAPLLLQLTSHHG